MAPPTATATETQTYTPSPGFLKPDDQPAGTAPLEPKLSQRDAASQVVKVPSPPTFTDKHEERAYLKGRLALAFRIFGKLGFDEGVAGHITLRDPVDPTTFWVNPFGVAFSLIKVSDLILVNHEGKVIDGGPCRLLNQAAYMIHAAVHKARPDVVCAAHSHSLYGKAYCALGKPLDITTQDSCAFYNDHAVYNSFRGVVLAKEEGEAIARALGPRKAILLQNHGLLSVAQTVDACVHWFIAMEKSCHAQLLADAAAGGRGIETLKIDDEDAALTYKSVGTPRAGWFNAKPVFDVMISQIGDEYLK